MVFRIKEGSGLATGVLIENSVICRVLSGFSRTIGAWVFGSKILDTLGSPPRYTSHQVMEESIFFKAASRLAALFLAPAAAAGSCLRRQSRHSRALNLRFPAFTAHSRILKAGGGIRAETALWLVALYPLVDYLMRLAPSLNFLAGAWDELLMAFIIVAWPLQMALGGRPAFRYTGLELPVLVYAGITLFLLFMRSGNFPLAVEGARIYLQYLMWFFVGANLLLSRRQFYALVKGMAAMAALVAAVGVYQYIAGVETPAHWVDQAETGIRARVFSIVVSPNVLGSLMVIFTAITAGLLLTARGRRERGACLAALAIMLACMVLTYSRGAWLALGLSATAFCLMYNPRLLIAMAAGFITSAKVVPGIGARLGYLFSPAYLASSQRAGRLALWQAALEKFRSDPLLGSGYGTFGGAVAARKVPGSFYVDNFYLKTLVEGGIVGLLSFLWLLASVFRHSYGAYKKIDDGGLKTMAAAILAALLGVAAHNTVENIFEVPMMATYFWFLAGVLAALPHIREN